MLAFSVPSVPPHRRALGEALRTCRKRAALTQESLAEKAGLSVVFISLVENGRQTISVDALLRIARALDVQLKDVVKGMK